MSNEVSTKQVDPVDALIKNIRGPAKDQLPVSQRARVEFFLRGAMTQIRNKPKLKALVDRGGKSLQSVGKAILDAMQCGIPIGQRNQGSLVPYKDECKLMIGYEAMKDAAYNHERVLSLNCDVVCENDEFEYQLGDHPSLTHKPCLKGPRGAMYAVYAVVHLKDAEYPVVEVMNREEVEAVKNSSAAVRNGRDTPWTGPFEAEMWKKSVMRRVAKRIPASVELSAALTADQDQLKAEEEHWADATVIDDPLAAGRHERRGKTDKAVEERLAWIKQGMEINADAFEKVFAEHGVASPEDAAGDAGLFDLIRADVNALIAE